MGGFLLTTLIGASLSTAVYYCVIVGCGLVAGIRTTCQRNRRKTQRQRREMREFHGFDPLFVLRKN